MNNGHHNRKRLVVLISGTGSTLQGIIDATRWDTLDAEVVAVFSHEPWSYGLMRAEQQGIPTTLHEITDYRLQGQGEGEYSLDLADQIAAMHPDLVILADWKVPLTEEFFLRFPNQVVNLQSGPPGQSPIFDPYAQNPVSRAYEAYSAGQIREAQVTVHMLHDMYSLGRVVAQEAIPIYDFDTLVDLEDRMHRVQQEVLVNTLNLLLREHDSYSDYLS